MPWVRLDEGFADHPKLREAGPLGLAMQVAGLCYCNRYLTDGFIPSSVVPTLLNLEGIGMNIWHGELMGGGDDATWQLVVDALLAVGLWEQVEGGYYIHDYLDYQPSRSQVIAEREQKREAGQRGGLASAQARAQARATAPAHTPAQAESKPVPGPVPGPVPLSESVESSQDHESACPQPTAAAKPKSKKETVVLGEDTDAYQLTALLREHILSNDAQAKVPALTPKAMAGWCGEMDLLIRVDNRAPPTIRAVIDWCQADSFWRANILSPSSLRKQFSRLYLAMQKPCKPNGAYRGSTQREVADDERDRALDAVFGAPESPSAF